jgi:exonuclease SbcD
VRILHTGDWHVGRTLHRRQRLEESTAVLGEVVAIAREETVDLVLVCGDVFEHYAPSAEAEKIVYATLLALRASGAEVVVIPGNHDNAKRFSAVEEVFAAAGVRIVSEVRRPQEGGVLELSARDGTRVQIACLPWVAERMLYTAADLMREQAEPFKEYAEELPRLIGLLCAGLDPDAVTLLAGHLFVSGAFVGASERELTVSQIFGIHAAALPTVVQYIALGHVHRPQDVPGAATPARYAGSLLQLDFGERGQAKSVTLVDVEPGRPARVSERALTLGRRLVQVRGTFDELAAHAVSEENEWLKVELVCDGPQPGLADEVRRILPNAVEVRLDYPRVDADRRAGDLRRLTPRELFACYYRERHGAELAGEVAALFDELLEEVGGAPA